MNFSGERQCFLSPPNGGGIKRFGDRNVLVCFGKLEHFCPQKTISRHMIESKDLGNLLMNEPQSGWDAKRGAWYRKKMYGGENVL